MEIDCITEYKKILISNKPNFFIDTFLSDSIDKFKITKHKDGNYPAIITISGWRSEVKDNRKEWEKSISVLYPDREWFHLEWNSEKLPFIDKATMTNMPEKFEENESKKPKFNFFIRGFPILVTTIFFSPIALLNIIPAVVSIAPPYWTALINNQWHTAVRNSKVTGDCLAKVLSACQGKEFILIGHSLGARVIYNCLEYLNENKLESNINEVHLLGGAVGSLTKKWSQISLLVKNNIYNYYSYYDCVLHIAYKAAMLTILPIGLARIINKKVINKNSSKIIKGHTEYIGKFHIVRHHTTQKQRWINRMERNKKKYSDLKKLEKNETNINLK